jgi:rod shape-determining protein MreD
VRRILLAALTLLCVVLIQVTVLNRLPLPGGTGPDLVLVTVVALALANGPMAGMLAGFAGGLLFDLAPPGTYLLGETALVLCVVGYGCGLMRVALERSRWQPVAAMAAMAVGVVGGETLTTAVGLMLRDPGFTTGTIEAVWPARVAYSLLISPFAVYAAVRVARSAGWLVGSRRHDGSLITAREAPNAWPAAAGGLAGLAARSGAQTLRDTGSGRSPQLRRAGARGGDGWIGGSHPPAGLGQSGLGNGRRRARQPRLRGGVAGSAAGLAAFTPSRRPRQARLRASALRGMTGGSAQSRAVGQAATPSRAPRVRRRRRDGVIGGSVLGRGLATLGGAAVAGAAPRSPRPASLRKLGRRRSVAGLVPRWMPGGAARAGTGAAPRFRPRHGLMWWLTAGLAGRHDHFDLLGRRGSRSVRVHLAAAGRAGHGPGPHLGSGSGRGQARRRRRAAGRLPVGGHDGVIGGSVLGNRGALATGRPSASPRWPGRRARLSRLRAALDGRTGEGLPAGLAGEGLLSTLTGGAGRGAGGAGGGGMGEGGAPADRLVFVDDLVFADEADLALIGELAPAGERDGMDRHEALDGREQMDELESVEAPGWADGEVPADAWKRGRS